MFGNNDLQNISISENSFQVSTDVSVSTEILTYSLACFALIIAAGGGTGGGGILVPVYTLLLHLDAKVAIPLANVTVFGGAVANFLYNNRRRHPKVEECNRPIIYWDLVLIMQPMTLSGALIGTYLNKIAPDWLLSILLVLLLGYTTIRTFKKAIEMRKKEISVAIVPNTNISDQISLDKRIGISKDINDINNINDTKDIIETNDIQLDDSKSSIDTSALPTLQYLLYEDEIISKKKLILFFLLFMGTTILLILKGGGGFPSFIGIQCMSISYWIIAILPIPFLLFIFNKIKNLLIQTYKEKLLVDYRFVQGDIHWTKEWFAKYPPICGLAGLIAGTFGIGGGIINAPLMLEMGILPVIASASSAAMMLFTGALSTISYAIFGSIHYKRAMIMFPMGFFMTLLGQILIGKIVKKYNNPSIIIFSISIIIMLSTIAMVIQTIESGLHAMIHGHNSAHSKIC